MNCPGLDGGTPAAQDGVRITTISAALIVALLFGSGFYAARQVPAPKYHTLIFTGTPADQIAWLEQMSKTNPMGQIPPPEGWGLAPNPVPVPKSETGG